MNAGVEPIFWMGNRYATDLQLVTHDPREITEDGFWAVLISFEGEWTCAKFSEVRESEFTSTGSDVVESSFESSLNKEDYVRYVSAIQENISDGGLSGKCLPNSQCRSSFRFFTSPSVFFNPEQQSGALRFVFATTES